MSFRLRKEVSVEGELCRIILEQAHALIEDLKQRDMVEGVHEARKRCKRLRATLRLIRPHAPQFYDRENRTLQKLAHSLASLRDNDARGEAFSGLLKRQKSGPEKFRPLRRLIGPKSEEATDRRQRLRPLATVAKVARQGLAQLHLPQHQGFELIEEGLFLSYARGRKAMRAAFAHRDVTTAHEWRKRVKDLHYHLQLLRDVRPQVLKGAINGLAKLGELLGEEHDLLIIRQTMSQHEKAGKNEALLHAYFKRLDHRVSRIQNKTKTLGRRFYAEKPKAFLRRMKKYWESWQVKRARALTRRHITRA